jgi:hypothetical protein
MNQIVRFKIGNLTNLIRKTSIIKQTQKTNAKYFN